MSHSSNSSASANRSVSPQTSGAGTRARQSWLDLLPALLLPGALIAAAIGACTPAVEPYEVLKGPFATALTTTSASIRWDVADENIARLTLIDSGGRETKVVGTASKHMLQTEFVSPWANLRADTVGLELLPDEQGEAWLHTVELQNLEPGSCYTYRIDGDKDNGLHRFCTMREKGDVLRIAVIGDTSNAVIKDTSDGDSDGGMVSFDGVVSKLVPYIKAEEPDFIAHTGDIQYYSSTVETWTHWGKTMRSLYSISGAMMTPGNHEFELCGLREDGTEIPEDSDDCFEFKDYYVRYFGNAGEGTNRWYTYSSGGVYFFSLDTESALSADSEQGKWLVAALENAMKQPDFRFNVLQFHRPIYTLGKYKPPATARAFLDTLLEPYQIRLLLAGHLHGYERFELETTLSLTTGGGGGLLAEVDKHAKDYPEDALMREAVKQEYHFTMLEIGKDSIKGKAINIEGEVFDDFEWALP